MKHKATACDISRAANGLQARAAELVKCQEKLLSSQRLNQVDVKFNKGATLSDEDVKKLVGTIPGIRACLSLLYLYHTTSNR